MGDVAYNPNDPLQQKLLSAIKLGETGNRSDAYTLGFGGANLGDVPVDQFGFPVWGGSRTSAGPTHAAGAYQFQPGTWASIAQRYGLDFRKPADQNAGAWYLAQETYRQRTGGDLTEALQNGQYSAIQSALSPVWASATGSGSLPGGLANALQTGAGSSILDGVTKFFSDPLGINKATGDIQSYVYDLFTRGGIIIVGALIILVALYFLLAQSGVVPKFY